MGATFQIVWKKPSAPDILSKAMLNVAFGMLYAALIGGAILVTLFLTDFGGYTNLITQYGSSEARDSINALVVLGIVLFGTVVGIYFFKYREYPKMAYQGYYELTETSIILHEKEENQEISIIDISDIKLVSAAEAAEALNGIWSVYPFNRKARNAAVDEFYKMSQCLDLSWIGQRNTDLIYAGKKLILMSMANGQKHVLNPVDAEALVGALKKRLDKK